MIYDNLNETDNLAEGIEDLEAPDDINPIEAGSRGFALETEGQISDSIELLNQVPEIQPEHWEGLNIDERLIAVQNVENIMAEVQNRPSVPVEIADLDPNEFGGFDGQSIIINQEHLSGGQNVEEIVDTIVHEGRHAYQNFVINHPEMISDHAIVQAWTDNFDNYLDLQNYGAELYNNQPVEQDAWQYAEAIRNGIYGK